MPDINESREEIEKITLEMLKLLKKRMQVSKEIGEIKKDLGKSVTDELREGNLRSKVVSLCKELDLDVSVGTKFLNFLLNESVKIQSGDKQTHLSIFRKAKHLEEQGKKIIHMEVGEPDFMPPSIVKKSLEQVFDMGFVRYGQVNGLPEFRKKLSEFVSKKFSCNITPENIIISPGARFAIYSAISTLLDPGDEIIVIEPAWPAYKDCALNAGIKVRTIKTTIEDRWEPSISEIEESINSNTKMITLNFPNNPTGKILPQKLQDKILEIAIKHDLYVLSDEIYSDYAYDDWKSVLEYNYKKSIITQSFSKSHSMTGFRIGYAIAEKEIIEKMAKLHALCLTNVSEPIQYVAMKSLDADTTKNSQIIENRIKSLIPKAKEAGLEFIEPNGAMYIFARVNKPNFDGIKFANDMLEKGLAVAPGEGFGDYRDFIRISACQDEKTLMEGMKILNDTLKD